MAEEKLTRHHRRPTSIGGSDQPENISMLPDKKHQAWHTLFANMTAFDIVKEINEKYLDAKYEYVIVNRLRSAKRGTT